ncbi:MAG: phosphatidylserine/phosphatidylglycerophosphate/cardiolipin synthase family protein [Candidatus Marinimicrobia bacterium]|nr:phosphatidylserine/phosphatidylglycerophosphate/cardiolipin synthase family protein [Candidatus Neomarinimicrobiota bacterium]
MKLINSAFLSRYVNVLCCVLLIGLIQGSCTYYFPSDSNPTKGTSTQNWFQDEALQKLLDLRTNSHESNENGVRLLVNGVNSFARRYENIRTAQFIYVKTFLFTDDEEGRRMAAVLAGRAQAGVPVVLQYDVKGSIESPQVIAEMLNQANALNPLGEKRIIREMREAGVIIVPTNSPSRPYELIEWSENIQRLFQDPVAALKRSGESLILHDYCDHEKYFITGHPDGEIRAIIGGMNIASEYALGGIPTLTDSISGKSGWHDVDVEIQGLAAKEIYKEFLRDMIVHTGQELPSMINETEVKFSKPLDTFQDSAQVRLVVHHPLTQRTRYVEECYYILLKSTPPDEPIFIATAYFAPSRRIREAIIEHANQGGMVTVLTNSIESNNHPILSVAANYAALQIMNKTENFRLYEWAPRPEAGEATMHQKVASFGHHGPVIVGSFNLDAQSAIHNTESIVLIDEPTFRKNFDELAEKYLSPSYSKRKLKYHLDTQPILKQIHSFLTHEFAWYWL